VLFVEFGGEEALLLGGCSGGVSGGGWRGCGGQVGMDFPQFFAERFDFAAERLNFGALLLQVLGAGRRPGTQQGHDSQA
jgi:hypothetical protein